MVDALADGSITTSTRRPATRDAAPLTVAFLVEDFPLLSETFVVEQAEGLLRRGVDLSIIAAAPNGAAAPAAYECVARLGLDERITRVREASGALAALSRAIRRRPASAPALTAAMARRPGQARATAAQAAAFSTVPSVDVLHCQFATLGLLAMRHERIGALRFRRLVVHLRGFDVTKFVEERGPDVYAALFRRADLFFANCEHFKRRAEALGCEPSKLVVIGSPVDVERFAPDGTPPLALEGGFRLAAVGRLVEKKGFADAVRAVAGLRRDGRDVRLEILGDGPLRGGLARLAAELGVSDAVRLLGPGSQADVLALLRRSHALAAPSVRAASGDEDAPVNTLKEAMAVGLPVVATRHGGIPELVEDGVDGRLAPERDPEALAAAIAALIDAGPEWRARMGTAGRAKVVARYGRDVVAERTISEYRSLMDLKRRRA